MNCNDFTRLALSTFFVTACSRSHSKAHSDAAPPADAAIVHDAATHPTSSIPAHWKGNYKSAASPLFIPGEHDVPNAAEWSRVVYKDTGDSAGVGEGALEWEVDAAIGRLTGTLTGPLGPASIVGTRTGDAITARIYPKEPSARSFYGTASATVSGNHIEGALSLSNFDGSHLRRAQFSLQP